MTSQYEQNKNNTFKDKMHFRVVVLDNDLTSRTKLEHSFLSMFIDHIRTMSYEDTVFYYVSDQNQLANVPDITTVNTAWISTDFPNWRDVAKRFYLENPFCYQVLYGNRLCLEKSILRSRPIGYVTNIEDVGEVHNEIHVISDLFQEEKNMLKLKSRFSSYMVSCDNVIYLQSEGRKTFIYINSPASNTLQEDDLLVKKASGTGELFAFVQNKKLEEIFDMMDKTIFVRIHQSYVINRRFVQRLTKAKSGWFLYLENKSGFATEIPVSEPYRKAVEYLFT